MQLKNYKNLEKMDFYLGSDTDDLLCGVIGLKAERYSSSYFCSNMSIIKNLKARDAIDNYNGQ
jgi:hypothetical protein